MRRTHLYEWHVKNARMIEFAGYEMPVWYSSIEEEAISVRKNVGIFDVSHMGRFVVLGRDSEDFLNYVLTRDLSRQDLGKAIYTVMCNEEGGIVDDLIVLKDEGRFILVVNASNREKDLRWLIEHKDGYEVEIRDASDDSLMIAIQGPRAIEYSSKVFDEDLSKLGRFSFIKKRTFGKDFIISRTGYTGEDGIELIVEGMSLKNSSEAVKIWETFLRLGEEYSIKPCGLGARDVLRLEAGMALYGNDIDETVNPIEARLKFVVSFKKDKFIGKERLLQISREGLKRVRVCMIMIDRGIPRRGFKIRDEHGREVGEVTSGSFSPLVRRGIGMGYVPPEVEKDGKVLIDIRGNLRSAKVMEPRAILRVIKNMMRGDCYEL
ncbi:MAG: glycine cleavage system aminomethyltransferase GcvT [Candidatus Asgardarchaeia archaeon]